MSHKRNKRQTNPPSMPARSNTAAEVPPGAVRADRSQQVSNNSYSPPPTFYVDKEFTCKDCGQSEVWSARQQKWYYEVAKGPLYATAVRCRACRRKRAATKGRGDPNPIKHPAAWMNRIRRRIEPLLQKTGFAFEGKRYGNWGRPASIEYARPGLILRCFFEPREVRLIAETLNDQAEYRIVANVRLAWPLPSAERLERVETFCAEIGDFLSMLGRHS